MEWDEEGDYKQRGQSNCRDEYGDDCPEEEE